MVVWCATGNKHKKKELADILFENIPSGKSAAWEIKIPSEAGIEFDPEENGSSFSENALIKARELYNLLEKNRPSLYTQGDPIIADDSGICVDALGGRPGIFSARYSGPNNGKSKESASGNEKKLESAERNALLLEELGDNTNRKARFVCALVLFYSPDRFFIVQETLEGELVKNAEEAKGKGGFGYDPILYIPSLGRTVAELTDEEKNQWSHRGKAGKALASFLFGKMLTHK